MANLTSDIKGRTTVTALGPRVVKFTSQFPLFV